MAMQHSIARMRAVIMPHIQRNQTNGAQDALFWGYTIIALCCILGLGVYALSGFLPSLMPTSAVVASAPPTLMLQNTQGSAFTPGQKIGFHGTNFAKNSAITFSLNGNTAVQNAGSAQASDKGDFDASITVGASWLAGNYTLQAQDSNGSKRAVTNIQVITSLTANYRNNTPLTLTDANGQAAGPLTFTEVNGEPDTNKSQLITLTNPNGGQIKWQAEAVTNNGQGWLVLDANRAVSGTLNTQDTATIGVRINHLGLRTSTQPYIGDIVITTQQGQAIIPVSLLIQEKTPEVVIAPNPLTAKAQGDGTCLSTIAEGDATHATPPATLTVVNLSAISTQVTVTPVDAAHISFDSTGGTLAPENQPGSSRSFTLKCTGIQVGAPYVVNVVVGHSTQVVNVVITQ
jgi:hypothetical protein